MKNTHLRRLRSRTLGAATLVACIAATQIATAAPIFITGANVWRADRTANPIGFPTTSLVPWIEVSLPTGNFADTVVTASVAGNTYTLTRIPTGVLTGTYFAQVPFDIALTDQWTINATNSTNGTNVATAIRPAFPLVQPMPFVSSIGFTGLGNNITVNWTVSPEGESRLDAQQVSIWDLSSFAAPRTTNFFALPAAARSVDLSSLLSAGVLYAVEINNVDRNSSTGYIDSFSGNWLSGWAITDGEVRLPTPVPEPGMLSLLLAGLAGMGVMRRRRAAGKG